MTVINCCGQRKERSDDISKTSVINSIKNIFYKVKEIITIEPLVGLYQMGVFLSKPALDNLELEKACRVNLRYNDTICDAILRGDHKNFSHENNNIQVIISEMHSWQQPIQSFMPLLLILFLGSYSDRHKWRKPFFIIPLIGDFLGIIGCLLCVINMKSWPIEIQGVFQKIVPSFFGTQSLLIMSTTAYVADISSIESRTFRIGMVTLVISLVVPIANAISGVLFLKTGYNGVLFLSLAMLMFALIYGILWIKEPQRTKEEEKLCLCADLFNPRHVLDTFGVFFRNTNELTHIKIMLLMVVIHKSAFEGEMNVFYLYVQNVFQWTPVDYAYFQTTNSAVSLLGNILGLYVFVKIFNAGDLLILFITIFSKIVSNIIYGCATVPGIFYVGASTSLVTKLYRIVKRSYATKIASADDIGKTQSLLGIAEALAPAASVPVYNLLYMKTLQTFPATIFFFSISLYSLCCFLIVWMHFKNVKNDQINEQKNDNVDGHGRYTSNTIETE